MFTGVRYRHVCMGKVPLAVTSMIVCVALVITGVLNIKQAFAGFIDTNVILFVAMFIVGGALFETGMANKVGGVIALRENRKTADLHHYGGGGVDVWRPLTPVPLRF